MVTLLEVVVCVGSSCYLRGADQVIEALQQVIAEHGVQDAVLLRAGFCLGQCMQGVVIRVGEQTLSGVAPGDVPALFDKYILPEVKSPGGLADQGSQL
ncbi:MAG: (2Fe-2S) ferredoxin domain-containing protein [Bacillota bacterium]